MKTCYQLIVLLIMSIVFYEAWYMLAVSDQENSYALKNTLSNDIRTNQSATDLAASVNTGTTPMPNISNFQTVISLKLTVDETTVKAQDCSMWNIPRNASSMVSGNPLIKLNSSLYLYPGLVGGPNNQIKGFFQSMYLAIRLNRTLVLPVFLAHHTHDGQLSPYQVIDVERVCQFVSCMFLEDLKEKCRNSFDVAFEAKVSPYWNIVLYEATTKMKVVQPDRILDLPSASKLHVSETNRRMEIPSFPGVNSSFKLGQSLPSDGAALKAIYNTTAPCAIVTSIFQQLELTLEKYAPFPLQLNSKADISAVKNNDLYAAIMDAVHHPPCIVTAASEYVKEILGDLSYVAVHWRYDESDWYKLCVVPFPEWCKNICEHVHDIEPTHIAMGIIDELKKSLKFDNSTQRMPVYIAAPPSLDAFRSKIYVELNAINKLFTKPAKSLMSFLSERYKTCWKETGWNIPEEIESLCEMEIMVQSEWFFYSPASTWSENIRPLRVISNSLLARKFEASIFNLAMKKI